MPQSEKEKKKAIQALTVDGSDVASLGLDFTLPGFPAYELQPGGAKIDVTAENIDEYVKVCVMMVCDGCDVCVMVCEGCDVMCVCVCVCECVCACDYNSKDENERFLLSFN